MKTFKEKYANNKHIWRREQQLMNFVFASHDEFRPQLRLPIAQGDFVYSTDAKILLKVPKTILFNEYNNTSNINMDRCAYKVLAAHEQQTYLTSQLRQVLAPLELIDHKELLDVDLKEDCPECDGSGDVVYHYHAGYDGEDYEERYDCPICDGTGRIDKCGNRLISIDVHGKRVCFNATNMARLYAALFHFDCDEFTLVGMSNGTYTFALGDTLATVTQMAITGAYKQRYKQTVKMI